MIRTALLIYAASMLAGASLAVGAVNGRFVGDTEAGPMVAELATGRDGELSGTLRCGEIIAPLTAREADGRFSGTFSSKSGRPIPISGSFDGKRLHLAMNGNEYDLAPSVESAPAPAVPAPGANAPEPQVEGKPATGHRQPPQTQPVAVEVREGHVFQYVIPAGWQVLEEGQFAVVLRSPDSAAITYLVGNAGLLPGSSPVQYLQQKLDALKLENLRFGEPRQGKPINGCEQAVDLDYTYTFKGVACRGTAKCSIHSIYNNLTFVMTAAASVEAQWASYAEWLPLVPQAAKALNGAAFGARGILQQDLVNSAALGKQAEANREASARLWEQVAADRDAVQKRQREDMRDTLGNTHTYDNPYDHRPVDLSANNSVYWVNMRTGQVVGDPSPSFDPRTPTDPNWQRMSGR